VIAHLDSTAFDIYLHDIHSVCVVSIIRLHSLNVLLNNTDLTRESDTTFGTRQVPSTNTHTPDNTVLALMWCVLELNLSIVGGSMPAMKPVLQKYAPKILASTHGQTDPESYYMNDSLSKPTKRSQRVTDPYNISRDRDSKSDTESERRIIVPGSEEITAVGGKSPDTGSGGVMGASYKKKSWSETITKTVEYGYEVDNEIASLPGHTSKQDEEAQMVRAKSPPRM
jgi:hypothetical protein